MKIYIIYKNSALTHENIELITDNDEMAMEVFNSNSDYILTTAEVMKG